MKTADPSDPSDPFLDKRIKRYDKWLSKKLISFSSKVISVYESLEDKQWILTGPG